MRILPHSSARRREVRRGMSRSDAMARHWWRRVDLMWAAVFVVMFTAVGGLVAVTAQWRARYSAGSVLAEPIVARVQFKAVDDDATRKRKDDAREREPNVYAANIGYRKFVLERLGRLAGLTANPSYTSFEQIPEATVKELGLTPEAWTELRRLVINGQPSPTWSVGVEGFIDDLFEIAVLAPESFRLERDPTQRAPKIVINHPNPAPPQRPAEVERYDDNLFTFDSPMEVERLRAALVKPIDKNFSPPVRRAVLTILSAQPRATYEYDKGLSETRKKLAAESEPAVERFVKADEVFVPAGKPLDNNDLALIEKEENSYAAQLVNAYRFYPMLITLGRLGVVAIVATAIWGYVLACNDRIARNPTRGFALTALLLLGQFVAVVATASGPRYLFLTGSAPTLFVGIVLAIAYDRRFAAAVAAFHALLVTHTLGAGIEFFIVLLVGVGVAVGQLNEVRTRSKLLVTGMSASFAMAAATLVAGAATRPLLVPFQLSRLWLDVEFSLISGIGTALLVGGILPAIESAFRVTTAMTLRELNDVTHPLLRRLAQEAPGTYQHSLRIADMAEAAADAIGAEALLCKVGAMYHDIGKINKPSYFIENQAGGPNRHEKLEPAMSLLIIVAHVKDGVEMAREFRLPPPVRQFIETHHGTTLVEYFYHAALKRLDSDQPQPDEFQYRYPGPKPQTREAAIMMICDGVEGAARTLPDPGPARFEQLVSHMIQKRLADGQLDECNITLDELNRVRRSIVKTLTAMYHGRIAYPVVPGSNAAAS